MTDHLRLMFFSYSRRENVGSSSTTRRSGNTRPRSALRQRPRQHRTGDVVPTCVGVNWRLAHGDRGRSPHLPRRSPREGFWDASGTHAGSSASVAGPAAVTRRDRGRGAPVQPARRHPERHPASPSRCQAPASGGRVPGRGGNSGSRRRVKTKRPSRIVSVRSHQKTTHGRRRRWPSQGWICRRSLASCSRSRTGTCCGRASGCSPRR